MNGTGTATDWIAGLALGLILLRAAAEWGLTWLNRRHVRARAQRVPEALVGMLEEETYRRSAQYTLAKARLAQVEAVWSGSLLVVVLFSGLLPRSWEWHRAFWGDGGWSVAWFLFAVAVGLSIANWPIEWYDQFHLEERFGFNTATPRVWWTDRLKGLLVSAALLLPLLRLLLWLVERLGQHWWWVGALVIVAFQLFVSWAAPVSLLPLFNKFTPLPQGPLRDRLLALAERAGYRLRAVEVMDGSRRSRHANAFFAGVGGSRKIVFDDTLVEQLEPDELEAVLAHEIGHDRLHHVPKRLVVHALMVTVGMAVLARLTHQPAFPAAFGMPAEPVGLVFLLFFLLAGVVGFWLSPLTHAWSRRHEYQADAFAARLLGHGEPLRRALRKLALRNLSNWTPHPLYSAFSYSHPTCLEREAALRRLETSGSKAPVDHPIR